MIHGVSWAPDSVTIAFSRGEFQNMNLYVANLRTGELRAVTDDGLSMLEPSAWSPGGARLLLLHGTWPTMDIHVTRFDRSRTDVLTASQGIEHMARWSPDGHWVAFASNREVNMQVYVINTDDGEVRRLTEDPAGSAAPSWSPDGTRIAFHSSRNGNQDIYSIAVSGGATRLTTHADPDMEPQWSPTGNHIAFVRGAAGNRAVYVMNSDGSGARVVSRHPSGDPRPRWSPDGSRLLYAGAADIHVVDLAGGDVATVSPATSLDSEAAWSPDGEWIAFVAGSGADAEVYVVHPDGSGLQRITEFGNAPALEAVAVAAADTVDRAPETAPDPVPEKKAESAEAAPVTEEKETVSEAADPPAKTTAEPEKTPEKMPEEKRPTPSESRKVSPAIVGAGAVGADITSESIPRAAVTSAVVDREPVDVLTEVPADTERVYFFTAIMNMTGKTVTHRWIYGDSVMAEVNFDVGGGHWRVYSTKRLLRTWTGPWRVEAVNADGDVLAARRFEVVVP